MTTTRQDGAFAFHAIRAGEYMLTARCVRYSEHRQRIEVRDANVEMEISLAEMPVKTSEITVTASRSLRGVENSAAAVEVIAYREIENTRPRYLGDLLSERVGLSIIDDHGTGIQVQGLDPQYTLILIDGNPVIGRTAGTVDLDRIMMDNVEKVEIVRGPTSSLYGSDALAGVINVITRVPDTAFRGVARAGYGTLASCSEAIVEPPARDPLPTTTVRDFPADTGKTGHYTFFPMSDSSIVPLADSATGKWDIGFNSTAIITNSGASGTEPSRYYTFKYFYQADGSRALTN